VAHTTNGRNLGKKCTARIVTDNHYLKFFDIKIALRGLLCCFLERVTSLCVSFHSRKTILNFMSNFIMSYFLTTSRTFVLLYNRRDHSRTRYIVFIYYVCHAKISLVCFLARFEFVPSATSTYAEVFIVGRCCNFGKIIIVGKK